MHGTCIRPQRSDTTQQTQGYTRHSTNAVSILKHWNSIGWMPRVCWEDCIIFLQICRNTMLQQSSHLPRKHKVEHHQCICIPGSVSMQIQSCYNYVLIIFCLHSMSSWKAWQAVRGGYPFFARAKQTLTQDIQPMLLQCWASVAVVGPSLRN